MGHSYSSKELEDFCQALFVAAGVPEAEAKVVASVFIDISLDGIDTHGINRLPITLSRLLNGRINAKPSIQIRNDGAVASINGDNGLGQLIAVRAMELGIELAKEYGVSFVTVKNSNHFGAASTYCKIAIKENMLAQVFTNSPCGIPPWGGIRSYFGTNPISFGFPHQDDSVIVDMSSSTVARGNIILAAKEGRPIPAGWAIDKYGNSTTDANAALEGAVLPIGGAKGYALALAVEVMAGIVTGSAYGSHVGWVYDDTLEPCNIGHSIMVLDINRLMPFEDFNQRMSDMIREIKEVPLAEGVSSIRIPGERRKSIAKERMEKGIILSDGLIKELKEIADRLGVNPAFLLEANI
jgi:LDH2 family malate/lactate/ureidoglycolate dehydrogenase